MMSQIPLITEKKYSLLSQGRTAPENNSSSGKLLNNWKSLFACFKRRDYTSQQLSGAPIHTAKFRESLITEPTLQPEPKKDVERASEPPETDPSLKKLYATLETQWRLCEESLHKTLDREPYKKKILKEDWLDRKISSMTSLGWNFFFLGLLGCSACSLLGLFSILGVSGVGAVASLFLFIGLSPHLSTIVAGASLPFLLPLPFLLLKGIFTLRESFLSREIKRELNRDFLKEQGLRAKKFLEAQKETLEFLKTTENTETCSLALMRYYTLLLQKERDELSSVDFLISQKRTPLPIWFIRSLSQKNLEIKFRPDVYATTKLQQAAMALSAPALASVLYALYTSEDPKQKQKALDIFVYLSRNSSEFNTVIQRFVLIELFERDQCRESRLRDEKSGDEVKRKQLLTALGISSHPLTNSLHTDNTKEKALREGRMKNSVALVKDFIYALHEVEPFTGVSKLCKSDALDLGAGAFLKKLIWHGMKGENPELFIIANFSVQFSDGYTNPERIWSLEKGRFVFIQESSWSLEKNKTKTEIECAQLGPVLDPFVKDVLPKRNG